MSSKTLDLNQPEDCRELIRLAIASERLWLAKDPSELSDDEVKDIAMRQFVKTPPLWVPCRKDLH